MMITAVYFQARPGVVFLDLLARYGSRPGAVSYVTFGAAAPWSPLSLRAKSDWTEANTPSRLLGLSDGSFRAAVIHRGGHVPLL